MKRLFFIGMASLVLVGVAAALFTRHLSSSQARVRAQAGRADAEQAAAAAAESAGQENERARRELAKLQEANARLAEEVLESRRERQARSTNADTGAGAVASPAPALTRVLQEPEMKETMRLQASNEVRRMVKQVVTSNLVERLGLTPGQSATLQELAGRKGMLGYDFLMPVMTGELDEAGLAAWGRRTKAAMGEADGQIRALLGEGGYRIYQGMERSQPDRERVAEVAAKLEGSDQALTPAAQERLMAVLSEERSRFPFVTDYNDTSRIDYEHFRDYYAPEKMNVYFEELGQLQELVLQRAREFLTPEQADELGAALAEHLKQSKYVIKTTNALFGRGAGGVAR